MKDKCQGDKKSPCKIITNVFYKKELICRVPVSQVLAYHTGRNVNNLQPRPALYVLRQRGQ